MERKGNGKGGGEEEGEEAEEIEEATGNKGEEPADRKKRPRNIFSLLQYL